MQVRKIWYSGIFSAWPFQNPSLVSGNLVRYIELKMIQYQKKQKTKQNKVRTLEEYWKLLKVHKDNIDMMLINFDKVFIEFANLRALRALIFTRLNYAPCASYSLAI